MEVLKPLTESTELVKEVYGDLAKPGVIKVGQALETVLGLGNTVLLPVTMLNEKAKIILQKNMEEFRHKIDAVPDEDIQNIAPEVGVPAVEKLMYVSDETLTDMYTELLTNAANNKNCHMAHPSFINIINNLSADEARLINEFSKSKTLAFLEVRQEIETGGFIIIDPTYTIYSYNNFFENKSNSGAFFSNLERLGLIDIRRDVHLYDKNIYSKLEEEYRNSPPIKAKTKLLKTLREIIELPQIEFDNKDELMSKLTNSKEYINRIKYNHGKMDITPLGELFIKACTTTK